MARVNKRKVQRKAFGPNAKKRGGRGPSPGTLHYRQKISAENVAFVKDCLLLHYRNARPWAFLKPEERINVTAIANALVDRHIVTSTTKPIVKVALIELDFQGVIDLPPPGARKPKKQ